MTVLLTGGSGYIGSHVAALLAERGEHVVIVDDLETGFAARVPGVPLLQLGLQDADAVARVSAFARDHDVDAVVHFAARKRVDESVSHPTRYVRDNLAGLANLLDAVRGLATSFVFSSSAAVYGQGAGVPLREDDPAEPMNPYGQSKLAGEWLVNAEAAAHGLRATSLRYFNVAGAGTPALGDRQALNLMPMVFERLVAGRQPRIFGDDYATPDGTCVRDFVHVADLADAHVLALDALRGSGQVSAAYNVGTGRGYSVREVIDAIGVASGRDVTPEVLPRRAGDPDLIVADPARITRELGWRARRDLPAMASSAWESYVAGTRDAR